MTAHTATVTNLILTRDMVFLVVARCDRCQATVTHGGGSDPSSLVLGDRRPHCKCTESYSLADPDNVIPLRIFAIAFEAAQKLSRKARRTGSAPISPVEWLEALGYQPPAQPTEH